MKDPGASLVKDLETKLLSMKLKPARPVGLRYDRLESLADVSPKPGRASYWYFLCNGLLISHLLARCKDVLVACGEGLTRDVLSCREGKVVRASPSSYEELSAQDHSFDGVVTDSSILLSGNVAARLKGFRQMLRLRGRICILAVNWEYEMSGQDETYETSFRRYGGRVYLGLLKRTLSPPREVEYVCLLDSRESLVQKLTSMGREELKNLSLSDVPEAARAVVSAEVIEIPQFTRASLENLGRTSGFSSVAVSGAPGLLAFRLFELAFRLVGEFARPRSISVSGSAPEAMATFGSSGESYLLMEKISQSLALTFPFISSVDNPHIVAVCDY